MNVEVSQFWLPESQGVDQTERDRLENSAAGQAGNTVGMVASIILPGPGGKTKATGWVARKIFGSLETALQNKVKSAIAKGIVAPKGNIGIIRLKATEAAATGYTHKIKIAGAIGDTRIYGRQGSNGHIIFDMIKGHKK